MVAPSVTIGRGFFGDKSERVDLLKLMFTGIIEETGTVVSFEEQQNSWRLVLAAEVVTQDLQMGELNSTYSVRRNV